ncbi:MAG TPA: DUF86 domain-containing protein [Nanoarchaeota archaeon]|nr:DUF86 domain-containing protein [Nanoarchaeota archaeon]HIH51227.1 DUF86 domain-containing protein [Nanoarchaeota archaeon]
MTEKYDLVFIEHILDSINAIEEFSRGVTKEEIIKNRLKQSAIIREIEVIGEAAKNVSKSLKSKWKEVEWSNIAGTRDKMIHHYFGVDLNIVWNIVRNDLPRLKEQMRKIKRGIR